jgi:hypothetical protein
VTDEERRTRYAAAIRRLADFFPRDCEERQKQLYFERLLAGKRHPDDVDQAIDREIDTRNQKSFPPWADIDKRLTDIAKDQISHRPVESEPPPQLSDEDMEAQLAEIRKLRVEVFPKAKPNIKTDREYRRKVLGITPLTQALQDDFDRKRRERERARHAKATTDPPDEVDEVF